MGRIADRDPSGFRVESLALVVQYSVREARQTMSESGYENAPATVMLATHCAVCARPLVDSVSVETGIGPDCRKKHGYGAEVSEVARTEGNAIVHAIAADPDMSREALAAAVARLRAIGFETLASVITTRRMGKPEIEITAANDGRLAVRTPFNPDALPAWRSIPGRAWDGSAKVNTVPASARARVWALLKAFHAGAVGIGPQGAFTVA